MVRGCLGRWRESLASAGQVAWEIAVAAGRAHLAAVHDVAMPQFLGRPAWLPAMHRDLLGGLTRFWQVAWLVSAADALSGGRHQRHAASRFTTRDSPHEHPHDSAGPSGSRGAGELDVAAWAAGLAEWLTVFQQGTHPDASVNSPAGCG